jgi:hypothetical protein
MHFLKSRLKVLDFTKKFLSSTSFKGGFGIFEDRGLIKLDGSDSGKFLQSLTTNDINKIENFNGHFTSFLTPQVLYFIFVVKMMVLN